MVGDIVSQLRGSRLVRELDVLDLIEEESVQYLKARVELVDNSVLHVRLMISESQSKYSYHWQAASGATLIRWDNAPHHKELPTHPHHTHRGKTVEPSSAVSITDVLAEIGAALKPPR